ncbi:MAG TPA: hypothetical protein VHH10_01875 [Rubrobacteraceae bacterium]|nr:hypothetical protein [Rubrobacteraceae bacterium]
MKKVAALMVTLALAVALSFAPAAAHEGDEEEASSEHFLGVNWDAPWLSRALVVGGLAVVGVAVYATQRR